MFGARKRFYAAAMIMRMDRSSFLVVYILVERGKTIELHDAPDCRERNRYGGKKNFSRGCATRARAREENDCSAFFPMYTCNRALDCFRLL